MPRFASKLTLIVLLGLLSVSMLVAQTPPALRITDNAGNAVTVDGTGVANFSSVCNNCSTTYVSAANAGQVVWAGTLGTFTITTTVGLTKPLTFPNPSQDLNIQRLTTTADGSITFQWSDTNFTAPGVTGGTLQVGGTLTGGANSTYSAYFDSTNTLFGTGTLVGTVGPFSAGAFSGTRTGSASPATPFAMTEVATINLTANSVFGVDFNFLALPAPLTLKCAASTGQVGVPYNSALLAGGGVPPYTYSIVTGSLPTGLTLNSSTGAITGTPTQAGTFSFTAQVVDSSGNSTSNTATASCSIIVTTPPPISLTCAGGTGQVGVPYDSFLVASGGVPPYNFSITSGSLPLGLTLNPSTGEISGTPTTAGPFNFTAQVKDSTNSVAGTATSNCGITIAPPLTAECVSNTTGTVGMPYSSQIVVSGGTPPYKFSIASGSLPPGLTLDANTGIISGTPTTAGPFSFTVSVTDSTSPHPLTVTTSNCGISISPPTITALCVAATTGTVGVPYSSSIQVTGGTAPYTFTLASGSLPPGLTLDSSTGVISGTPTAAGPFSFTVQVTDSTPGQHATATTANCGITIAPPTLTALCVSATTGTVGVPYSSSIQVTGGTAPYTFALASGSLPPGLTLNTTTGVISGTPTTAGPFSFTVQVTDSTSGQHATATTANCGITIAPPTMTALCVSATTGTVGVPYSSSIQVTGGTAPYTFALASGALPPGLTLNTTTGVISGTPTTAGPFSFTVQVTDSTLGQHATATTANCGITIAPPTMTALCVSATTGIVGSPYSSSIQVTGGTAPYTFALASGSLPPGLTLNTTTGVISGTPTTAGSFSFTVKVTDSTLGVHATATTANCSIVISSPPLNVCGVTWGYWKNHVSLWPVTSLVLGSQTYSQTELINILGMAVKGDESISLAHQLIAAKLNVANGTNPTTDNGAIAAADSLLSQFSGKLPYSVAPSSTIGQQMTVVEGQLDDFNSDGKLQPGCTMPGGGNPQPINLACATSTGTVGVVYSSALVASGGVGPYTFSLTSGSLPPGLTLNTSTGAITGTPTSAGTFNFTAKVVDSTGSAAGTTTSNCGITVSPSQTAPLKLACATSTGQVGVNYSSALVATGGVPPYTYSISSGSLPAGLLLNASTGAITGIPTASGNFNFTGKVVDSSGGSSNTTTNQCGINVAPPSTTNVCGVTWGYWKNHTNNWGAASLILGKQTYTKAELITILQTPVKGDASINLAHQLIAAKLNVLDGTPIATAGGNITSADALLAQFPGKLPYGVSSSSTIGAQMTAVSSNLDDFNSDGKLQPGCIMPQ